MVRQTYSFFTSSPHLASWFILVLMLPACRRSGHVILFSLPSDSVQPQVELGMVMTVWRGVKNPRPHSGDVQVNSCVAFRAVQLAMETEETALGLDWGTLKDYKMIVPGR